jgi:hypothetical protein
MLNVNANIISSKIGSGSSIPSRSDALFWIDGTIVDITGSKYFQDRNNGKLFPITGYDFDSTWGKGFPYKTAATISAPAGDATLIAADINNFLYDSGGTPNQIPVVSLFQDIDYEHKLFCRHADQVLDSNGVETYEPRILDIVLYNTVKSGIDLTTCQSYYNVPTEITTNVRWISPTGSDTSGDGTKAHPWATFAKAQTSGTTGDTIYVKTGIYTVAGYFNTKKLYHKGIGYSNLISTTTYALALGITGSTFTGLKIDGGSLLNTVYYNAGSTCNNIVFEKCSIGSNYNISKMTIPATYAINTQLLNCIFYGTGTGSVLYINESTLISGCFFNCPNAGYSINLQKMTSGVDQCIYYNKINKQIYLNCSGNLDLSYNKLTCSLTVNDVSLTGELKIWHNNVTNANFLTAVSFTNLRFTHDIQYNTFNVITGCYQIQNQSSFIFKHNNVLAIVSATDHCEVTVIPSTTTTCTIDISENNFESRSHSSNVIYCGDGTFNSSKNDKIAGVIEGNKIIGPYKWGSGSGSNHSILVLFQKGITVNRNYVSYSANGIVMKDYNRATTTSTCNYNVIYNCNCGIECKGYADLPLIGNTVYNNLWTDGSGIRASVTVDEELSEYPPTNAYFKNNIVIDKSAANTFSCYYIGVDPCGLIFDYNVGYSDNNGYGSIGDGSFIAWQVAGYGEHDLNQDVSFYSVLNKQFWPIPTITSGEDLGTDYDDGLDITTDWGSDTEVPIVVTKQQGANWNIGAYVQ